jgi:hypothetical protein
MLPPLGRVKALRLDGKIRDRAKARPHASYRQALSGFSTPLPLGEKHPGRGNAAPTGSPVATMGTGGSKNQPPARQPEYAYFRLVPQFKFRGCRSMLRPQTPRQQVRLACFPNIRARTCEAAICGWTMTALHRSGFRSFCETRAGGKSVLAMMLYDPPVAGWNSAEIPIPAPAGDGFRPVSGAAGEPCGQRRARMRGLLRCRPRLPEFPDQYARACARVVYLRSPARKAGRDVRFCQVRRTEGSRNPRRL